MASPLVAWMPPRTTPGHLIPLSVPSIRPGVAEARLHGPSEAYRY